MGKRKKCIRIMIHGLILVLGLLAGIFIALESGRKGGGRLAAVGEKAVNEFVWKVSEKAEKNIQIYLSSERTKAAVGTPETDYKLVQDDAKFSYGGFGRVNALVVYHIPGDSERAFLYHCGGEEDLTIAYDFIVGFDGKIQKADYKGEGRRKFDYRTVEYEGAVSISEKEIDAVANSFLKEEKEEENQELLFNKDGKKSLRCDRTTQEAEDGDQNSFDGKQAVSFRLYEEETPGRELLAYTEAEIGEGLTWTDGHDYNFDGWYDLRLDTNHGTRYFLWNQSDRKYERNTSLEALETPVFDLERKCVYEEKDGPPQTITCYVYKENELELVREAAWDKDGESWLELAAYDSVYEKNYASAIENSIEKNSILAFLYASTKEPALTFDYPYSLTFKLHPEPEKSKEYFGIEIPQCLLTFYLEADISDKAGWKLTCDGLSKEGTAEMLYALHRQAEKKQKPIPKEDMEYVADMGKEAGLFRFYFSGLGQRSDRDGLVYDRYWLDIYGGEKKKPIQSMLFETTVKLNAGFADVNFDGYTDFYFDESDGKAGTGLEGRRLYCLWDSEAGQFKLQKSGLSLMGGLTFLPGKKLILEDHLITDSSGSRKAYRYENGVLKPVWSIAVKENGDRTVTVREEDFETGTEGMVQEYQFPETEWGDPGLSDRWNCYRE